MEVDPAAAVDRGRYAGETYYFCSPSCHSRFNAHPEKFIYRSNTPGETSSKPFTAHEPSPRYGSAGRSTTHDSPFTIHHSSSTPLYTCPMHPEIERDQPGDCPICGMALELKTISADSAEDDSDLIDMTRRFWIGAALTLPVFLLAMSHLIPHTPSWLSDDESRWIQFVLSTPVVLGAGFD